MTIIAAMATAKTNSWRVPSTIHSDASKANPAIEAYFNKGYLISAPVTKQPIDNINNMKNNTLKDTMNEHIENPMTTTVNIIQILFKGAVRAVSIFSTCL